MSDSPPLKRRRRTSSAGNDDDSTTNRNQKASIDQDDGEIDSSLLQEWMDGGVDDFQSSEERAAQEAQRRREQRRRRLQQVRPPSPPQHESSVTAEPPPSQKPLAQSSASEPVKQETSDKSSDDDDDDDDDDFDMFSSSVSPVSTKATNQNESTNLKQQGHEQEDWDDAEGYYKANIGEIITFDRAMIASSTSTVSGSSVGDGEIRLRVGGVIGKGVFSSVLKCTTVSNSSSIEIPPVVALKCIRHNDTMAKAAMNELRMLQRLKGATGIVPLLFPTTENKAVVEYRGHVVMVFSYMEYNLRDVLQKFGKGVGLSLQAVRSYFGQLLAAATHLKKHRIIHADLKPDNILVGADFAAVQIADFGSAMDVDSAEAQTATPYLVSRFYRAPEIILGLVPTYAIDLWSLAVTVAELFLGNVLFTGKSNNDMLYCFMQHIGPFSNRMIRQHVAQGQRLGTTVVPQHFSQDGAAYLFKQQTVDPISGEMVYQTRSLLTEKQQTTGAHTGKKFPLATPLNQKILKARSGTDSRSMVLHFSDLLQKCLTLDPSRRIDLREALRHDFFTTTTSTKPSQDQK